LNNIVKNWKDTEKCYAQCGRFSGQGRPWNSHHLKNWRVCWPRGLNKLEAVMQ
jgi:hypothetical protein